MTLKPQDTVLIISPAGRVMNEHMDNAVAILTSWGLNVEMSTNCKGEYHNFSGTVEQRLSDLQWALDHPTAKAIFAARGGYGLIHLLDKLDWTAFRQMPKLLIGYSDICNLHPTIHRLGFSSIHGLMPNSFPQGDEHQLSLTSLQEVLFNAPYAITWNDVRNTSHLTLEGKIIGGNLSILYSLQGTPYAPDYKDRILFLEDLCEYLYHTDRMLNNFALAGVFNQAKAILVGDFSDMKDNDRPFGKSITELFRGISESYNIPVIFGLKTGHSDPTLALPLGRKARLSLAEEHCTLLFEE